MSEVISADHGTRPAPEHTSQGFGTTGRNGIRNDQDARMTSTEARELAGERQKVIAIAGHEHTPLVGSVPQLGPVIESITPDVVYTDGVEAKIPGDLANRG